MGNGRLNEVRPQTRIGSLSAQDIADLAAWFDGVGTNEDPDKVLPVPNCYKPVIAWTQMFASDMVDESNHEMKPWNMPANVADYWADIWYAQRVGMLQSMARQKTQALAQAAEGDMPRSPFTGVRIDPDKGVGRA